MSKEPKTKDTQRRDPQQREFIKHLSETDSIVSRWPNWKRQIVEGKSIDASGKRSGQRTDKQVS